MTAEAATPGQARSRFSVGSTVRGGADTIGRVRFFVHPPLTSAVADALVRHGHAVAPLTDVAGDPQAILTAAKAAQLDVITSDPKLADASVAGDVGFNRSIVYLLVGPGEVEQDDAIDRLFERYKRLSPGRLYSVTASRVKIRQIPTTHSPV